MLPCLGWTYRMSSSGLRTDLAVRPRPGHRHFGRCARRARCMGRHSTDLGRWDVAGRAESRRQAFFRGAGSVLKIAGETPNSTITHADSYFSVVELYMSWADSQLTELTADTSVDWASPAVEHARHEREKSSILAVIVGVAAVALAISGITYLITSSFVISISLLGVATLVGLAVITGIIEHAQAAAWRRIAVERREIWEARQRDLPACAYRSYREDED